MFRKFAADFADKYKMPTINLDEAARSVLENYRWPGNIRQLKNVTEQISVIEPTKDINSQILMQYLPSNGDKSLPVLYHKEEESYSEREILYKILFEMKQDMTDLKKLVYEVIDSDGTNSNSEKGEKLMRKIYGENDEPDFEDDMPIKLEQYSRRKDDFERGNKIS